ncbi:MAG TPA: C39 family peptidase [Anaerolineaceae bacterium]|nr:C39 family peptidase [Anaerolineaceae bacterium]
MRKVGSFFFGALATLVVLSVAGFALYQIPPIQERLAWRLDALQSKIKYTFSPPEQVIFVPQDQIDRVVQATLAALTPTRMPTATASPSPTAAPAETQTPQVSPTATLVPTPIPGEVDLKGIIHEYQKWNNCGPATLAMALTYWGWKGDQRDTAPYLKPNDRDKNVMPYEMKDYVDTQTKFRAVVRVGGDLDLLKRLIAAGFPVVVEKGFVVSKEGWMGHYEVVNGYNDAKAQFITQDSYIMANLPVPYQEMQTFWQNFNYLYLVIYPPDREQEVMAVLGPAADETTAFQEAVLVASNETVQTNGRALYFAWYNRGTNLVNLGDYAGAAQAYDEAFNVYPTIAEKDRPWRNIWYQTGPYFAYYYTGRYQDVINLARTTLDYLSNEPTLEESWVWKARAEAVLGDTKTAIDDLHNALKYHEGFVPALEELQSLGAGN